MPDSTKWVVSYAGVAEPTVTDVEDIADEAAILRNRVTSGVNFRKGAVLVKIGVHPPVTNDAALKAAASAIIGRL
jgi:hypothetical protein